MYWLLTAATLTLAASPLTAARAADAAVAPPRAPAAEAPAPAGAPLTLAALLDLARASNAGLAAGRDRLAAARAAIDSAAAYPNPEIEFAQGPYAPRGVDGRDGRTQGWSVTQRIDPPWQRATRRQVAEAGATGEGAALREVETQTLALVRTRYFELLWREAQVQAARDDLDLIEDIRSRIRVRVETGEAPRYELIKADAELLNAQQAVQSAHLRVEQARAALRQAVGPALPARFTVSGEVVPPPPLPPLETLRDTLLRDNPQLARLRAEVDRGEQALLLERQLRQPTVALKAGTDRDPDVRSSRVGVVLTVPLWDRRAGPIGEALARRDEARHRAEQAEFELSQALEAAYRQHEIAKTRIAAFEQGILREAEAALRVAEAAYRFGERGILDYLDAQRVFRAARNDLISARHELRLARTEIDALRGIQ